MRKWRSETGAALLEAAFTIPILLLVTVGILEFGRAYQTWQVLTNAAREGARIAVLPDLTAPVVQQRVRDYMQAGQLSRYGTATVTVNRAATLTVNGARRLGVAGRGRLSVHLHRPAAGGPVGQPLDHARLAVTMTPKP